MEYGKIIKRSFTITWGYRALWWFGILLAMVGGRSCVNSNNSFNYNGPSGNSLPSGDDTLSDFPGIPDIPDFSWEWIIPIVLAGTLLIVVMFVIFWIIRYVSETSLIKMVTLKEESGVTLSFREGLTLGWCPEARRLFWIDFQINLIGMGVMLLLLGIASLPLLLWFVDSSYGAIGTVLAVILFIPVIVTAMIVGLFVSGLTMISQRTAIFETGTAWGAIQHGWSICKNNFNAFAAVVGIQLGISFILAIVMFVAGLIIMLLGLIVGGVIGAAVGAMFYFGISETAGWTAGGIVGGIIAIFAILIPIFWIRGLIETYFSTYWTLIYRDIKELPSFDDCIGISTDESGAIHNGDMDIA